MPSSACAAAQPRVSPVPTRRSSDLPWRARGRAAHRAGTRLRSRRDGREPREHRDQRRHAVEWPDYSQRPAVCDWRLGSGRRGHRDWRSEEHTSELQSPCKLVCRLPLAPPRSRAYPLSLRDARPISLGELEAGLRTALARGFAAAVTAASPASTEINVDTPSSGQTIPSGRRFVIGGWAVDAAGTGTGDRKSTRLNSSHLVNSYAVFRLRRRAAARIPCPYATLVRSPLASSRPGCAPRWHAASQPP